MDSKDREEVLSKMAQISEIVDSKLDRETQSRESITYYDDLTIGNSGLAEQNAYVVKIANQDARTEGKSKGELSDDVDALEKYPSYEIYDENNNLIATVDKEGKVHFSEEYIAEIEKKYGALAKQLNLNDVDFTMPDELTDKDISLTKEELSEYKEKEQERGVGRGREREQTTKEEETREKGEEQKQTEQENEEEKKQETAKVLGIRPEDIKAISSIDPNQKVTDKERLADIMPEAAQYKEVQISLTNPTEKSNGMFTLIGVKDNGEREVIDSVEPVEGTSGNKNVITMNEDGSEVTEKQVKGLLQINARSRTDGIAVSVGSYGMMDIDYVQNVRNQETRRAIPIRTKEAENQRIPTAAVREQGGDPISEVNKEGENFRRRQEEGIDPQSMDGIDVDESDGKRSLEDIKREIIDKALEQGDMSGTELREFIQQEIEKEGLTLTEGERENTIADISEVVIDESRFPTRGEHH